MTLTFIFKRSGGEGGVEWTEKAVSATCKESKAVFWPAPCLKETSLGNSYSLQKGPKILCQSYKSFFLHFKNIAYTHYRSCSPCQIFVDCGSTKNKPARKHALKTYEHSESVWDQKPVLYKNIQSINQSSYHKRGSWILRQCAHSSEPTVSHSAVATWSENTKQNSTVFMKAVTLSQRHHWKSHDCVVPVVPKSSSWLSVIYNNDDNQSSSLYPHFSSMLMLKMEWWRPILDFSGYHRLVLVIHHPHWHTETTN